MRPRGLLFGALLCALPASGGSVQLSEDQIDALTSIDEAPARAQIDLAFGPSQSVPALIAIATDPSKDLGLQIRAIRTLPQYCEAANCAGAVHDTLVSIITSYRALLPTPLLSTDVLRLRAAIEALGATHSGLRTDVDLLTNQPLLHHPSRDLQATAVHALRNLCSPDLCDHDACSEADREVRALRSGAGDTQVDAAINSALQDLAACDQP